MVKPRARLIAEHLVNRFPVTQNAPEHRSICRAHSPTRADSADSFFSDRFLCVGHDVQALDGCEAAECGLPQFAVILPVTNDRSAQAIQMLPIHRSDSFNLFPIRQSCLALPFLITFPFVRTEQFERPSDIGALVWNSLGNDKSEPMRKRRQPLDQ